MSERVSVTLTTGSASPASSGPASGRYFIAGQTGLGSATDPTVIRSLAEYVAKYGPRTGGTAMYDAAEVFLDRANAGELVVMRATGPSAVKATITLDSKITVTARNPGASYNGWTAQFATSGNTLTIVKGATTAVYQGTTAALLEAAAAVDPDVTVTVTSLPAGNFGPTALASGTDDYANVVWATTLALIPDSLGPGAVATPGVPFGTSGSALASHAKTNRRLALVSAAAGVSRTTMVSNMTTIAAYTGAENTVAVYPWVKVSDGGTGKKPVDPVSFAAAARAIAHNVYGAGQSPLVSEVCARITGVEAEYALSTADWTALDAVHCATIRPMTSGLRLYGWQTAASPGNPNLWDAQFRDIVNAVAADCSTVLERFLGRPGTSPVLGQALAEVSGAVAAYSEWLKPDVTATGRVNHPGYRVTVSNGPNPADNRISASVSLRLAEYADFIDFTVAAYDAGAVI